ncbi:MAG: hypothetical protein ACSHWZ_14535 [Sulfitobacter sp.]
MTDKTPTMLDILRFGERQEGKTACQYEKHLKLMFKKRGYADRHLEALDGTLEVYLQVAPKFSVNDAHLMGKISSWGITPKTYKQYQTDGRRVIDSYYGDLQKRRERRSRQDGFARLQAVLPDLVKGGLIKAGQTRNLPRLFDLARAREWDMTDITRDRVISLREDCLNSDEWGRVKQGAAFLDYLRVFPTCLSLLPPSAIGSLIGVLRLDEIIPDFLADEAKTWVKEATVVYQEDMVTEEAREATAKSYSDSSKGVYTAALRHYIMTASEFCDFRSVNGLTALFEPYLIEKTLTRQCGRSDTKGGLAPRTLFSYSLVLKRVLADQDLTTASEKVERLIKTLSLLVQGQAASKIMSPKVEVWCRNLISDPLAAEIFETQHFRYVEKALAAIELASIEDIDLQAFSRFPERQALSPERARLATRLLDQARMYGVCAAFAAIELEGAPFRKSNVINDLKLFGHPQTFFDHRDDKLNPRYEVYFPNELLKNGQAMTRRSQYLPRFTFEKGGLGCEGFRILSFYLSKIRPLFPGADHSDHVFPALHAETRPLVLSTFDGWLAACSASIGLYLLPHNFRHGVCTLEIFHDPTCFEELETLTGDTTATLRQHYAFIDRERQSRSLQQKRFDRRAMRQSTSTISKGGME